MTEEERTEICKAIAASCMWGHSGLGSVIVDKLDQHLPHVLSWRELYEANKKAKILSRYLARGYWLTNPDEDGCSLFILPR